MVRATANLFARHQGGCGRTKYTRGVWGTKYTRRVWENKIHQSLCSLKPISLYVKFDLYYKHLKNLNTTIKGFNNTQTTVNAILGQ
jgi:predicted ribonuclease toxin of YeeF-YezG toxin-antitoxin module